MPAAFHPFPQGRPAPRPALTLIFNDTVIPRITQEIEGLFGAAN